VTRAAPRARARWHRRHGGTPRGSGDRCPAWGQRDACVRTHVSARTSTLDDDSRTMASSSAARRVTCCANGASPASDDVEAGPRVSPSLQVQATPRNRSRGRCPAMT
jgi:hypothetical protein